MEISIKEPQYHNPDYLIATTQIDSETMITCAMNIKDGSCKMEFYSGENYVPGARWRSYSRVYEEGKIPQKHKEVYNKLKGVVKAWYTA